MDELENVSPATVGRIMSSCYRLANTRLPFDFKSVCEDAGIVPDAFTTGFFYGFVSHPTIGVDDKTRMFVLKPKSVRL